MKHTNRAGRIVETHAGADATLNWSHVTFAEIGIFIRDDGRFTVSHIEAARVVKVDGAVDVAVAGSAVSFSNAEFKSCGKVAW